MNRQQYFRSAPARYQSAINRPARPMGSGNLNVPAQTSSQRVPSGNTSSNSFPETDLVAYSRSPNVQNQASSVGDWTYTDASSPADLYNSTEDLISEYTNEPSSQGPAIGSPAVQSATRSLHRNNDGSVSNLQGLLPTSAEASDLNSAPMTLMPEGMLRTDGSNAGQPGAPPMLPPTTVNSPPLGGADPDQENLFASGEAVSTSFATLSGPASFGPSPVEPSAPPFNQTLTCPDSARRIVARMIVDLILAMHLNLDILLNFISVQSFNHRTEPSQQTMMLPVELLEIRENMAVVIGGVRRLGRIHCQTRVALGNTLEWIVRALRSLCESLLEEESDTTFVNPLLPPTPLPPQHPQPPMQRLLELRREVFVYLEDKFQQGCREIGNMFTRRFEPGFFKCPQPGCSVCFPRPVRFRRSPSLAHRHGQRMQSYYRHIEVFDPKQVWVCLDPLCREDHQRKFHHRKERFVTHRSTYHPGFPVPEPMQIQNPVEERPCPRCGQICVGWDNFYKEHYPFCNPVDGQSNRFQNWSPYTHYRAQTAAGGHQALQPPTSYLDHGQANSGYSITHNHAGPPSSMIRSHSSHIAPDPGSTPLSPDARLEKAEVPSRATALWHIVEERLLPLRSSSRARHSPTQPVRFIHQSLRQFVDMILLGAHFQGEQASLAGEKPFSQQDIEQDLNRLSNIDLRQLSDKNGRTLSTPTFAARHDRYDLCSRRTSSWPLSVNLATCPHCNRLGCVRRCKINSVFEVKQGLIRRRTENLQAWHPWSLRIDLYKFLPWLTQSPTPSLTRSTTSLDPDDARSAFVDTFQSLSLDAGREACHTEDEDSLTDSDTIKKVAAEDWPVYYIYEKGPGLKSWRIKHHRSSSCLSPRKISFSAARKQSTLDKSVIYDEPDTITDKRVEEVTDDWPLNSDSMYLMTSATSEGA